MKNKKLEHQEILSKRKSIDEMNCIDRFPFLVMLNNIRSMHNIGSIFRTADAACIEKIIITGYTACPPRPEIEKTALGATNTVPWHFFKNPLEAMRFYESQNVVFLALEQTEESISVYDYQVPNDKKICLVLGNEVYGVDQKIIDRCDSSIEIPMYGMKHSLNVSVAAGIATFELIREMNLAKPIFAI
jgi:23S rRNA (guanosine2251-2'-O)-methyltransferase